MVYGIECWRVHNYDWSKRTQIRAYNSPRRKMIPLYNSQGEETVFVVTGSGGNLNKGHGVHGFSSSNWMADV